MNLWWTPVPRCGWCQTKHAMRSPYRGPDGGDYCSGACADEALRIGSQTQCTPEGIRETIRRSNPHSRSVQLFDRDFCVMVYVRIPWWSLLLFGWLHWRVKRQVREVVAIVKPAHVHVEVRVGVRVRKTAPS